MAKCLKMVLNYVTNDFISDIHFLSTSHGARDNEKFHSTDIFYTPQRDTQELPSFTILFFTRHEKSFFVHFNIFIMKNEHLNGT